VNARRTARIALLLAAATAAVAAAATTTRTPAPATPAEWRTYDVLLPFQDLPTSYSCDDLWYKFRDLLLKLGARAYMTVSPYHCGYVGGGPAPSPSVELRFQLPQVLHGTAATRYAQISVVEKTIRLAPGAPPSLKPSDCELMKQLQNLLFPALPLHVSTAAFSCAPPHASFALTVSASVAVRAAARAASVAANTPSSLQPKSPGDPAPR
jgi:hypothetical protein